MTSHSLIICYSSRVLVLVVCYPPLSGTWEVNMTSERDMVAEEYLPDAPKPNCPIKWPLASAGPGCRGSQPWLCLSELSSCSYYCSQSHFWLPSPFPHFPSQASGKSVISNLSPLTHTGGRGQHKPTGREVVMTATPHTLQNDVAYHPIGVPQTWARVTVSILPMRQNTQQSRVNCLVCSSNLSLQITKTQIIFA